MNFKHEFDKSASKNQDKCLITDSFSQVSPALNIPAGMGKTWSEPKVFCREEISAPGVPVLS